MECEECGIENAHTVDCAENPEREPTRCSYAQLYCHASIQGPEEWIQCENQATRSGENGEDVCEDHEADTYDRSNDYDDEDR